MPMLQAILLSAGDFARGALHAKIFPEPIRMQLLDFYSHDLITGCVEITSRQVKKLKNSLMMMSFHGETIVYQVSGVLLKFYQVLSIL